MSNWRIVIKDYIKSILKPVYVNGVLISGIDGVNRFTYWNSQNRALTNQTEAVPRLSIYFDWSFVGEERMFTRQTNLKAASFIPTQFTIHVLLTNFSNLEKAVDELSDKAYAVKQLLSNLQHELFVTRVSMVRENTDINHDSHVEYEITFKVLVKDEVNATGEIRDINDNIIGICKDTSITESAAPIIVSGSTI